MLLRKMRRDLWMHKGTYLAGMLLITIGILVYNLYSIIHASFSDSLDNYYEAFRFADGTLRVVEMPLGVAEEIGGIENVDQAEGRLLHRIKLLDYDKEVQFDFLSYDDKKENPLNAVELMGGRMPDPKEREILMGNLYFEAMDMALGDRVPVVVNGRQYDLTVVGWGRSPEFIYAKKNDSELIADPKGFDMVYMPYDSMSEMLGMRGRINNVAFSLKDPTEFDGTARRIEEAVQKYGLVSLTGREEQISHVATRQKLEAIGSMAQSFPGMFLLVSGIIIYIVLRRVIEQERTQIGVIKSMGVSDLRLLFHYISYALVISLLGGSIGILAGITLVPYVIGLLGMGFNMPFVTLGLYRTYIINSYLLTLGFGLVSGYAGAKNCVRLRPADAMRPPVSKEGKASLVDKLYFLFEGTGMKTRLAVRNILRNKGRSLFILFGVSVTAAFLVFPISMQRVYMKLIMEHFEKVEVYDLKVTLTGYMDQEALVQELSHRPGILRVEPQAVLPVEMYNGWRMEKTSIISIPVDSTMYRLYDNQDREVALGSQGLMLSHYLADRLGVEAGDRVSLKSPLFRDEGYRSLEVVKVIPQYMGMNGYMNIQGVGDLLEGPGVANALMVQGSGQALEALTRDYKQSPEVSTFEYRKDLKSQLDFYMDQATSMIGILVVVGMATGFSVITVSTTIALSERSSELATLLVMGMGEGEVHQVLLIEEAILAFFGILAGLPLGKALLALFSEASSTEYFVLPAIVPVEALAFSVVMTTVAILLPQWAGRRKIRNINVTEALNARQ
ncbi:ABC transporter permease [Anaerotalea alkaliphila]|uniref:FtsX-like permease family protein n=1 Tax=Anaerotalea alkaliphila TaxID=2662126 RepID=A0A7X5KNY1_9FIRM|nr:FtsX-like permease family protein [Anaerotalea alkaliphila]NDL68298.1 FtsX-like permease family protein [Anaerotalea alkaliphila]